jgi:hypothetical protein
MISLSDAAVRYSQLGLRVIPVHGIKGTKCTCGVRSCSSPGKHPRIRWGAAQMSEDDLRSWWEKFPESNVGIVTGRVSGIAVIDIDGEKGLASLEKAGFLFKDFPPTPTVRTGGRGFHLIYKMPEDLSVKTRAGIYQNVDIRGEGGLIVAPPSLHASGRIYSWIEGKSLEDIEIADFDFAAFLPHQAEPEVPEKGGRWFEEYLKGVSEGARDAAATRLSGRYVSLGLSEEEALFLLRAWNMRNSPPLPSNELAKCYHSIVRAEKEHGSTDKREDLLSAISNILHLHLKDIRRITGDKSQLILKFREGEVRMTTSELLSPKTFQDAVAEGTKVVVKRLSTKTLPTHESLSQMVLRCAEDEDAGIEATVTGEMRSVLQDFISKSHFIPNIDDGDEIPQAGPFMHQGLPWVQIEDLIYRSGKKWGIHMTMKSVAQRLKALGMERKTFKLPDESKKQMWGIDLEKLI